MRRSTAILCSVIFVLCLAFTLFGQNPSGGYGPGQGSGVGTSTNLQVLYNAGGAVAGGPVYNNNTANSIMVQAAGFGVAGLIPAITGNGTGFISSGVTGSGGALSTVNSFSSNSNCSSSASPAVCGSAMSGSVVVAAGATTVQVNSTATTANSQIQLTFDSSLGTKLSVTCNTTPVQPTVSARTGGTSFTITVPTAPTTNPACFSYTIFN